ncbi:MAG: PilZ domain-containing protein [Bacillota bacterium]|nr:PilZ domain-containing protein [Bacillota bacterium]
MNYIAEHRKYQRCSSKICKAEIKAGDGEWDEVELKDISAGGLKFLSKRIYELQSPVCVDIFVYSVFSEFNMKLNGTIIRKDHDRDCLSYSVCFDSMDRYKRVQLDEIIKSKLCINDSKHPAFEDGMYEFLFLPKTRLSKVKFLK